VESCRARAGVKGGCEALQVLNFVLISKTQNSKTMLDLTMEGNSENHPHAGVRLSE
jgi:hypothetical protein